jgi:hypothetical protein
MIVTDRQTAEALDCLTSARRCVGRAVARAHVSDDEAAERHRRALVAKRLVDDAIFLLHEPYVAKGD